MHKLLIALDRGAAARKALVGVLVMLGLVVALAGCSGGSGGSPLANMGYGDEHPADAPGDMPGH